MPKILRIINRFNLGGPTFNAAYLTKYLPDKYETLLVGGLPDESEESSLHIFEQLNIEPYIIPRMFREIDFPNDLKSIRVIKDLIRDYKPEIVCTSASKAGAVGRIAAHQMKVPIVVHTFHGNVFHSYFGRAKSYVYQMIERYLSRMSSSIIAISAKQKEELVDRFKIAPEHKVHIIPLGFDLNKFSVDMDFKRKKFRSTYNILKDTIAIGIVGRLVPIKNHSMFIKAIKYVKENSNISVRGFVIGDGEERLKMEKLAVNLDLEFSDGKNIGSNDDITFTSWIKQIDEVNAGMDIIALTSMNEGTPVSLIEAQASNKPIVSTNVGGIEDIVKVNETALLSESMDQEKFNLNLLRLVENESLRIKMANQGLCFVKDRFSFQRLVRDFDQHYSALLENHFGTHKI